MTRKNYIEFAKFFNEAIQNTDLDTETVENLARDFTIYLQVENPNFNQPKFLQACGL